MRRPVGAIVILLIVILANIGAIFFSASTGHFGPINILNYAAVGYASYVLGKILAD